MFAAYRTRPESALRFIKGCARVGAPCRHCADDALRFSPLGAGLLKRSRKDRSRGNGSKTDKVARPISNSCWKAGHRACCLRAVNAIKSAFYGLGCHLSPCMSLELRFLVDSIPSAVTILFNDLPRKGPHGSTLVAVLKRRTLARIGSQRTAHLRHSRPFCHYCF